MARSLLFGRGNTGATPKWKAPEFPDSSVGAESPETIGFYRSGKI
jgi:hypothetical protein